MGSLLARAQACIRLVSIFYKWPSICLDPCPLGQQWTCVERSRWALRTSELWDWAVCVRKIIHKIYILRFIYLLLFYLNWVKQPKSNFLNFVFADFYFFVIKSLKDLMMSENSGSFWMTHKMFFRKICGSHLKIFLKIKRNHETEFKVFWVIYFSYILH